jgi:hypothetical protein
MVGLNLLSLAFATPCDMMNAVAQTKPTSKELRAKVNQLRSTAEMRLMQWRILRAIQEP